MVVLHQRDNELFVSGGSLRPQEHVRDRRALHPIVGVGKYQEEVTQAEYSWEKMWNAEKTSSSGVSVSGSSTHPRARSFVLSAVWVVV